MNSARKCVFMDQNYYQIQSFFEKLCVHFLIFLETHQKYVYLYYLGNYQIFKIFPNNWTFSNVHFQRFFKHYVLFSRQSIVKRNVEYLTLELLKNLTLVIEISQGLSLGQWNQPNAQFLNIYFYIFLYSPNEGLVACLKLQTVKTTSKHFQLKKAPQKNQPKITS